MLSRFFGAALDWRGPTGRGMFAAAFLLFYAALAAMAALPKFSLSYVAAGLVAALLLLVLAGHQRRRLRTVGWSGYWMWLTLAPVFGPLLALVLFAKRPAAEPRREPASWAARLAFVLLAALIAVRVFWAPYWIPSGNMKPTLLVGDYLAVTPLWRAPDRGDVLVYRHPANGQEYISRVIGLPGDRIQMRAGQIILNDTPVPQARAAEFAEPMAPQGPLGHYPRCGNSPVPLGVSCLKQRLVETLPNGRSYSTLDIDLMQNDFTPVFTVPVGHYFFLGDNRDNSADSRVPPIVGGAGFIAGENLLGRVARVLVSEPDATYWAVSNWRWSRVFKEIK